jgi:hypothetical protein
MTATTAERLTSHREYRTLSEIHQRVDDYSRLLPELFALHQIPVTINRASDMDTFFTIGSVNKPIVKLKAHIWKPMNNNRLGQFTILHTIEADFDRSPQNHIRDIEDRFRKYRVPLLIGQDCESEQRPDEALMLKLERKNEKRQHLLLLKYSSSIELDEDPKTVFAFWKLRLASTEEVLIFLTKELGLQYSGRIVW